MPNEFTIFQKSIELLFSIEERHAQLLRKELEKLPGGSLHLKMVSGKTYYGYAIDGTRHSITQDLDLVYQLARKRYVQLKLQEYENTCLCSGDRRTVRMRPVAKQLRKLLENYRRARLDLMRITLTPKQYHWVHSHYQTNPYPKDLEYITYSGIVMRSKSERDIGNEMELEGIPYRYEQGVRAKVQWMSGVERISSDGYKIYYPDFLILTATGEVIFWEHLGRVDLPDYRMRFAERVSAIRLGGLCSEKNLILTFEYDLKDSNFIREIIARRILPYV